MGRPGAGRENGGRGMSNATRGALVRGGRAASLALLVAFRAAGQWGPGLIGVPNYIVPPLSEVYAEFVRMWQVSHLLLHTGVTAGEVVAGVLLRRPPRALVRYFPRPFPHARVPVLPPLPALLIQP